MVSEAAAGSTDYPDKDSGGNKDTMTKWLSAIGLGVALGLLPVIFGMPGLIVCGVSGGVMVGAVGARRFAKRDVERAFWTEAQLLTLAATALVVFFGLYILPGLLYSF